jgi:hypothetical protein
VGIAASTIAEKLSVYCEGSGRLAFGAALWIAVLAGMSDETLNTWDPFGLKLNHPEFSKDRAKPGVGIIDHIYQMVRWRRPGFNGCFHPVISARPARFAAHPCGKRDCFAAAAPILMACFSVVSDRPQGLSGGARGSSHNSLVEHANRTMAPGEEGSATEPVPSKPIVVI